MVGRMVELDRLYSSAATWASNVGDIAALNTKSVGLETTPCWMGFDPGKVSSYQSTTDRLPVPLTVCCVHIPVIGSPRACVSRPSRVSMWLDVPLSGAEKGTVYGLTLISASGCKLPAESMCQPAGLVWVLEGP